MAEGDDITREGLILRIWARTRPQVETPLEINSVVNDIRRIAAAVDNVSITPERPVVGGGAGKPPG